MAHEFDPPTKQRRNIVCATNDQKELNRKIDSCLSMVLGALHNGVRGASKWEVENDLFLALHDLVRYDSPMAESIRKAYRTKTLEEALAFVREMKKERFAVEIRALRARRRMASV